MRAVKLVVLLPLVGRFVFNPLHFSIYGLSISFFGTYRLLLVMFKLMIVSRHCSRIGTPNHSLGLRYKWPATCSKLKKCLVLLDSGRHVSQATNPFGIALARAAPLESKGGKLGFLFWYCTISINSSATVTRDTPDENMVSSGGWDERDKYKFSSGSRFFFRI